MRLNTENAQGWDTRPRGKRFVRGIRCCIHIGFAKSFTAEVAELKAECPEKN